MEKGSRWEGEAGNPRNPHVPMPSATPELPWDHSPPHQCLRHPPWKPSSVLNPDSWVLDLREQRRGWGAESPRPSGPGCHTLG